MDVKKLFKSGNSVVVSIGGEAKEWLKVQAGDQVIVQCSPGPKVTITKATKGLIAIAEDQGGSNG